MSAATSSAPTSSCVDRRDRVLPEQRLLRDLGAEVARDRAHVAVGQLEPGPGERVGELVRVLEEAPRDRLVDRVEAQREVGGQHRRRRGVSEPSSGSGTVSGAGAVLRLPLVRAGRALGQLPLVAEQVLEEAVVPLASACAVQVTSRPLVIASRALAGAVACSSSRGPAPRAGRPRARGRRTRPGRPRRGSCRRCGRRRSARRSPRRSSPSGGTSRGCRGPRRAGPGCRSGPPG